MQNTPHLSADKVQLLIWWVIWAAILNGLVVIYFFLGRGPVEPAADGDVLLNLVGLVPLFVSIIIRWLVLPRCTEVKKALPVYIVGLALAESCGVLGIFLGGAYRDDLFLLGVLGVIQFAPLFVRKFQGAKGPGFGRG